MSGEFLCLNPVETAIDGAIGQDPEAQPLPDIDPNVTPIAALERALLPALQRPPCLVAFGGRDSSALLAVATRVARREGLPLPVPATDVFPEVPESDESSWQELVIRHLELPDWHRRTYTHELDLVGPVAQECLRRHGLLAPARAYDLVPMLRDANGGTVVTGLEGDGVFVWGYWRICAVLSRRERPTVRDLLRIARAASPSGVRRVWLRHFASGLRVPWLRPSAEAELQSAWAAAKAREPVRWGSRVHWWWRRAGLTLSCQAFDLFAKDCGAQFVHPFVDPGFLTALSRYGGWAGFGDRTSAMRTFFGDLLPPEVLSRTDKADFTRTHWNEHSRAFAASWTGRGLPDELIDTDVLRRNWQAGPSDSPDMRAALLFQTAWLAESANGKPKQFNCRLE
jgi:hypothetical protein